MHGTLPRNPILRSEQQSRSTGQQADTSSCVVGDRVAVQWENGVHEGVVTSYDKNLRLFLIHYDDGNVGWAPTLGRGLKILGDASTSMTKKQSNSKERACPICLESMTSNPEGWLHKLCPACLAAWGGSESPGLKA